MFLKNTSSLVYCRREVWLLQACLKRLFNWVSMFIADIKSKTEAWHICSTPSCTGSMFPQWILHKLGVTVHRCLQGKAPQYLVNCCHPTSDIASRQRLRSSSCHHLVVPWHCRSTFGRRAFSIAGPMAWNALPDDLRDPSLSADNFRKTLKTHLFRNALGHLAH